MRLLLDTHALIWTLSEPERLGSARDVVGDPRNRVYVSAVSPWEMVIKLGTGKLAVRRSLQTWLPGALTEADLTLLPIELSHVLAVEQLPEYHRDPFDRLLIAQALMEDLTIVTRDAWFEQYSAPVIRC